MSGSAAGGLAQMYHSIAYVVSFPEIRRVGNHDTEIDGLVLFAGYSVTFFVFF